MVKTIIVKGSNAALQSRIFHDLDLFNSKIVRYLERKQRIFFQRPFISFHRIPCPEHCYKHIQLVDRYSKVIQIRRLSSTVWHQSDHRYCSNELFESIFTGKKDVTMMQTYLALGAKCFETENLSSVSHCAGSSCRVRSFINQQECTCFEEGNLFQVCDL